jgi:uridine kinase
MWRRSGYRPAMGRLVIISGPPGAEKSTVARRLSQRTGSPLAMHMHTDDMYAYVKKGFVPPWGRSRGHRTSP